jgi:hypothetical protein
MLNLPEWVRLPNLTPSGLILSRLPSPTLGGVDTISAARALLVRNPGEAVDLHIILAFFHSIGILTKRENWIMELVGADSAASSVGTESDLSALAIRPL